MYFCDLQNCRRHENKNEFIDVPVKCMVIKCKKLIIIIIYKYDTRDKVDKYDTRDKIVEKNVWVF